MKDASTLPLPSLGWSQHDTAPPTRTTSNVCSRCNCSSPARFLHLLVPTSSIANQHQRLRLSLLASKLSGEPVRHPYLWRSGNSSPVSTVTETVRHRQPHARTPPSMSFRLCQRCTEESEEQQ